VTAGTESERNAAAELQTEARRICGKANAACDVRAACEVQRSNPRVGHGGQNFPVCLVSRAICGYILLATNLREERHDALREWVKPILSFI
jgi:hypothetical protein